MHRFIPPILIVFAVGCTHQPSVVQPSRENLSVVRNTIAELMAIPEQNLRNDIPLSQLPTPMDELDLVELVMELEEAQRVVIPDHLLVDSAGSNGANVLPQRLTINKLAKILESAKPMPEVPVTLE